VASTSALTWSKLDWGQNCKRGNTYEAQILQNGHVPVSDTYQISILHGYSRIRTHEVSELNILIKIYMLSDTYKILHKYTKILIKYFTYTYPRKIEVFNIAATSNT